MFGGGEHPAEALDLAELAQDSVFHGLLDDLHAGRAGEGVLHVPEEARFLEQDGLCVRGEAHVFLARGGERLVGAVAVRGVRRIHVSQQQLDGGPGEVVLELMRDERAAAGLDVQFETLRALIRPEDVAHPDGPESAADSGEREVFDLQATIEEEGETRAEVVHIEAACAEELGVGEAVGERVGGLLHGGRTRLGDVVAADRNRIPARHPRGGVFHHVGEETQRGIEREKNFVLRLHFLEDVGLHGAAQLSDDARPAPPARGGDIHGEEDWRGAVDGHRDGEMRVAEREAGVEPLHVFDGVDGYAALADLSEDAIRVAVEAVERRAVEGGAEADAALVMGEEVEARVGVLREAEAGEEARRLLGRDVAGGTGALPIHLAIDGVCEREFAGQSVAEHDPRDLAGLVRHGQGERGQFEAGGCAHRADAFADRLPAREQLCAKPGVFARAAHLFGDEERVSFDAVTDAGESAHLHTSSKSRSTPASRCRLATVAMTRWPR